MITDHCYLDWVVGVVSVLVEVVVIVAVVIVNTTTGARTLTLSRSMQNKCSSTAQGYGNSSLSDICFVMTEPRVLIDISELLV